MLQLSTVLDGEVKKFPLVGDEVRLGRGSDNDIVLADFSVSRHHAVLKREADGWVVYDQASTNGVQVNGSLVRKAALHVGDQLGVGVFEIEIEPVVTRTVAPAAAAEPARLEEDRAERLKKLSNATIVRPVSEVLESYGLDLAMAAAQASERPGSPERLATPAPDRVKREALAQAYDNKIFGFLIRLGGMLISANSVDAVLVQVMEVVFEALPVERGFILLRDDEGEISCRLARFKDRTEFSPQGQVPVSQTMLQAVMNEQVALLSYDALSDRRLSAGESIRIHQIRAAMCTPLWSGERIIGVLQVDSPFHVGTFNQQDLDFLTALANYAAVAVERIRYAHRAEQDRQVRSRLERYHSPAVIQEILRQGEVVAGDGGRRLKAVEATVLFADLVGFTALAETLAPETLTHLLEDFFTHSAEAVFDQGGTLDKFIGDCVMAFFGAPVEVADHALRGVRAAMQVQAALAAGNAERAARGLPELRARIAVNSGPVVVGEIGSNRRVDYTVLGNTVNVAARIEQFAAQPGQVVIGQGTWERLDGQVLARSLGEFQLKGLRQKVTVHEVLGSRLRTAP